MSSRLRHPCLCLPPLFVFLTLTALPHRVHAQATLTADYRFEEGSGTALFDSISNTAQGTTNGTFSDDVPAAVVPRTGVANAHSLVLNNPTPGLQSASFTSDFILNAGHPDATLQFSVKAASQNNASVFWTTSDNDAQDAIPNDDADNRFNIYLSTESDGSLALNFDYREPGNFNAIHLLTPTPLPLVVSAWNNVAVTRTGGNVYTFYVNGQQVETYTDPNPNLPTANSASNPWTIAGRLMGGANEDLDGEIDEVSFADTALDPGDFSATPTVTLTKVIPSVAAESGDYAEFLLTLSAAQTDVLHVNVAIKGSATDGKDYEFVKNKVKIKPGHTTKEVLIVPEGDLGGASAKSVKLALEPGTGYAVATEGKVKVKITAPPNIIVLP